MSNSNDAVFLQGNLMRHVTFMSLTTSIGLMAVFAVDLIDIYFISLLGQKTLAAAAGYASAIMFFTSSVNIGLSIAAGVVVARAVGAGEMDKAKHLATTSALVSIALGIAIPLAILPNSDALLNFLGAKDDVAELAAIYLTIIIPFTVFSGVSMVAVVVLRAYGAGRMSMYPLVIGGLVNVVLDPIFIFTFDMGLHGAAWATVVARFVTLVAALYPAVKLHSAFAAPKLATLKEDIPAVASITVPAVLTNIATPVGAAIVTREMAQYGADAVAGMAVIGRLSLVAFAGVYALSAAVGPIIGQNFGASFPRRVRSTFLDALMFLAVYVITVSAILFLTRSMIADAFGVQGLGRDLLLLYAGPIALGSVFLGMVFVSNAAFNNLGHASYSSGINWGLNTIGTWPFVTLGSMAFGAQGVLVGQVAGTLVFAALAVWLSLRVIKDPQAKDCEIAVLDCDLPNFDLEPDRQRHRHSLQSRSVVRDIRAVILGSSARRCKAVEGA